MAKAFQRKDGRWEFRFNYKGKRRSCYPASNKQKDIFSAQKAKEQEIDEKERLEAEKKEARRNPLLDDYYAEWYQSLENRGIGEATRYNIKGLYRKHIQSYFGKYKLSEISTVEVKGFRKSMIESETTSNTTINRVISLLGQILGEAVDDEIIAVNPCRKRSLAPLPVGESNGGKYGNHRYLSNAEINAFFSYADNDEFYRNLYKLALYTGCRIGELSALRITDIDFEADTISISKTMTTDITGNVVEGEECKTASSRRVIPMHKEARKAIEEQLAFREKVFGDSIDRQNAYLFFNKRLEPLTRININRNLTGLCKKAGVSKFSAHAFRTTFTNILRASDCPDRIVDDLVGHSRIDTTSRYYGLSDLEQMRYWVNEAFKKLEHADLRLVV